MAFAQLSKVRLEYFAHGEGPERVLLIHGFQASAAIWRLVQAALPADRYTSIAINNRGAGGSEAPPREEDFSVQIFAADAFELVTELGWRDFTLVGHSLGGATVAQFAVDHPDLIKGLVLLDPSDPDGRQLPQEGPTLDDVIERAMSARRAQQAAGAAGDGIDAAALRGPSSEVARAVATDMRNAPEQRLRGSMRSMFQLRIGERVKDLPMPVLMAAGDIDELIPISAMLATWAKFPTGSGLHVWHGVGHSPNLDAPGDVAALLRRFVETTIPARTARRAAPVAADPG
ncbi:MAG TPA: alpha/beta hydrolase [Caulobacteraceae bacterium]|jgi:branched-chain amino acid transport system permease protein|nr:alpha/beta hydrolase [Caulobacteraceae bacterium]